MDRTIAGTIELSFDELPGAQRYNLYAGALSSVRNVIYDHGTGAPTGPFCDASTETATEGRLEILHGTGQQANENTYFLVTAHVDDVEFPAGRASDWTEIDRSASTCR